MNLIKEILSYETQRAPKCDRKEMGLFDRCDSCNEYGFYGGKIGRHLYCEGYKDILKEEGITPAEERIRLLRFIYKIHNVPEDNAKLSDEISAAILIILGYNDGTIKKILF